MSKPLSLLINSKLTTMASSARAFSLYFPLLSKPPLFTTKHSLFLFSTTSTPYPLQYDMIINRPTKSSLTPYHRRPAKPDSDPDSEPDPEPEPTESSGLDTWLDEKLSSDDKGKRKYYNKRRRRLYGSDSEDERRERFEKESLVELKPHVVEFDRLHQREEELYFHDAFAYPWEKDKHYKMVYKLEKKYFPDHCLDKAFVQPGDSVTEVSGGKMRMKGKKEEGGDGEDKNLVFFDEEEKEKGVVAVEGVKKKDVMEKKVEEFFKCLKKVPSKDGELVESEPYLVTRSSELPPRWDGPNGTVLLVNKPKGWTSFTVCGKLRRLVKVKKVGHAGTLDPMATGLLIVCVGKATKLVERYQGMVKGYSGIFRLGEATSTWDADSPVIQREPWEHIKDDDIKKAIASFSGEIWQVPPMFSAIKVGGERMYDKARKGESVELSPRRVSIFQFDIERSLEDRQNLVFRVTCSKGTYIRSLCADLGKALGSCAHLTALRRDSIGQYSADDAWEFKELEEAITRGYF